MEYHIIERPEIEGYQVHVKHQYSRDQDSLLLTPEMYEQLIQWLDTKDEPLKNYVMDMMPDEEEYLTTGLPTGIIEELILAFTPDQSHEFESFLKDNTIKELFSTDEINRIAKKELQTHILYASILEKETYKALINCLKNDNKNPLNEEEQAAKKELVLQYAIQCLFLYLTSKQEDSQTSSPALDLDDQELIYIVDIKGQHLITLYSMSDEPTFTVGMRFHEDKPNNTIVYLDTLIQLEIAFEDMFNEEFDEEEFVDLGLLR